MRTIIFTGSSGEGIALAAAATASATAHAGQRTLLASVGPSHTITTLVGASLCETPQPIAPNLDLWTLESAARINPLWETVRPRFSGVLGSLSGDEFPLIPGIDHALGLEYLHRLAKQQAYDVLIMDASDHDMLLRVLPMPDTLRWAIRLVLGLDREPGASTTSLERALLPATIMNLLPFEWLNQLQALRVLLEHVRDEMTETTRSTVRYVLRPDSASLAHAMLAIPAIHMNGLAVDSLIVGPLIPPDVTDTRLIESARHHADITAAAGRIWTVPHPNAADTIIRPVFSLPMGMPIGNVVALHQLSTLLYTDHDPAANYGATSPIEHQLGDQPCLSIRLPGVRRETLGLTISGDELIVRVGPYRRHILLPAALRGTANIRASREGERLVVRRRGS